VSPDRWDAETKTAYMHGGNYTALNGLYAGRPVPEQTKRYEAKEQKKLGA